MSEIPWTWFAMRASGLVSVALLTIAVSLGIIGPRLGPTARLATITVHRASTIAGSALIAGHVVLAILDEWIVLDWTAALLPGAAAWEPWGVALGAVAVDLMLALLITTATRRSWPGLWRRTHLMAYPAWALAVGHGLLVATDGTAMRALALGSLGLVLLAIAIRLVVHPRTPSAPVLGAEEPAPTTALGGAR